MDEWPTNIKYLDTLMKTSYIIAQSKPLKPMENQPAPFATYEYIVYMCSLSEKHTNNH